MKKRRFFKIICCFCLLLCSTLFLTACTGGGSGDSGSGSGYDSDNPPKPDPDKQPPSSGDDSDIDIDDDGNIGGNGQVADFSDYFYGYMGMIKGNDEFEVQDEATGSKVKFNALLDRQFDVLAQDILYRLYYVYGNQRTNNVDLSLEQKLFVNSSVESPKIYMYNGNVAIVNSNKLLSTTQSVDSLKDINLTDINDYQKSLKIVDEEANYLMNGNYINIIKAIDGAFMELDISGIVPELKSAVNSNFSWKWSSANSDTLLTDFRSKDNINKFKMALAQIVSGVDVDGNYTDTNYNKLLSNMDYLGYLKSSFIYKNNNVEYNKLVEFIKNIIIGKNLIDNDDKYAKIYIDDFDGKFNVSVVRSINDNPNYNETYSPHMYKGYSVILPAIVNQALNNTFESTKTSLYPYYARSSSKNGDFETRKITNSSGEVVEEMTTTGPITLDKIILKPKANSQPVALQLQIAAARKLNNGEQSDDINDLGCYAHDIVVELEVNITYKATYYTNENGVQVAHPYVLNMPTYVPDGEDSGVLTIDSKGYIPTYIDTNDPNFDPTKVTFDPNNPNAKDPYSESFRKPYDTNGEILPFNYVFSIYNKYTDDTPKMGAYNGPSDASSMTLFNNGYKSDDSSVYLDSGDNYIQFTFNIKSVKKYSGDNSTQLVDASEYKNDVVFDISLMPFTF